MPGLRAARGTTSSMPKGQVQCNYGGLHVWQYVTPVGGVVRKPGRRTSGHTGERAGGMPSWCRRTA